VADGQSWRKPAVITGAYYLDGQNLRIAAGLTTRSGETLFAIDPVAGPRADPGAVVLAMRQRILGAAVAYLDPGLLPGTLTRPPLYDAYREYVAGVELFITDYPGAIAHLQRAIDLDPDFFPARLLKCFAFLNTGDRVRATTALAEMAAVRDRLSRTDRLMLDYATAIVDGRESDTLTLLRQVERADPSSLMVNYLIGYQAIRLNRPQETIDEYAKATGRTWDGVTMGGWRFTRLATAHHLLGRHDDELRLAREGTRHFPASVANRGDEMYALAALGRMDDLQRAMDDVLTVASSTATTAGAIIRQVAVELRRHGHAAASLDAARRAVSWHTARPADTQRSDAARFSLAQSLYVAERWTESADLAKPLSKAHPDNVEYAGLAGSAAARLGERRAALIYDAALVRMRATRGDVPLARAQIAALLGDRQQALDGLREAVAQGTVFGLGLHRNMDFESLRGWPPYDEFMRPKE
jgi:tetratricopeptide (TPR) repeat protein